MRLVACTLLFTTLSSFSYGQSGLGSHEHGSIKLDLAVEGKNIELEIDGAAESFLGFEHAAKTAKEKKAFSDAQNLWENDLTTKLFVLDNKLGCSVVEASFDQEQGKGNHSDIEAKAKITCQNNLKGQKVEVAFKKYFTHIKKLQVDLVSTETKTLTITKAVESLTL